MVLILGYWRYNAALETANELFDRSLLAAALAISKDVVQSEGDALEPSTRDLIKDAAGEQVFYHVSGPEGSYLTGYAYPPVLVPLNKTLQNRPEYFDGYYRSEPVRVIRILERSSNGFLVGDAVVTVWQPITVRHLFAQKLGVRAMALMGSLLLTLGLVVWFGVNLGLRPLTDLQDAIASRSPTDLSTIKRPIPVEAHGIVTTLNRLFGQMARSLDDHQIFISDASHQLRNPAAAVLSTAEAVRDANSDTDRAFRVEEMVNAARSLSRVTEQMLSLERLKQHNWTDSCREFDLNELARQVCTDAAASILGKGLEFGFRDYQKPLKVFGEEMLLTEALKNLIDNALVHGGADMNTIDVELFEENGCACINVIDDGVSLVPSDQDKAFSRFGQLEPSGGSGLGLAIAYSVAEVHSGQLRINDVEEGASILLCIPLVKGGTKV